MSGSKNRALAASTKTFVASSGFVVEFALLHH